MAFVDMAFLCKKNIHNGYICYTRKKTGQQLVIRVEPLIQKIISRYAGQTKRSQYLLPIISSEDPVIAFSQYQTALGYYNKLLKRISKILDLDISLSSTPRAIHGLRRHAIIMCRFRLLVQEWDILRRKQHKSI